MIALALNFECGEESIWLNCALFGRRSSGMQNALIDIASKMLAICSIIFKLASSKLVGAPQ